MIKARSCKLVLSGDVLEAIKGMRVGVFSIKNVDQSDSLIRDQCEQLLKEYWNHSGTHFSLEDAQIMAWRGCFSKCGINTKKHPSSVESLAKRASKDPSKPRSINPLVDFYNAMAVKHMIPLGAFDLDALQGKEMTWRMTRQGDTYEALDASTREIVPIGEPAFIMEPEIVVVRHMNWRQSKVALVSDSTTNMLVKVELLPSVTDEDWKAFVDDVRQQCWKIFNQKVEFHLLTTAGQHTELVY